MARVSDIIFCLKATSIPSGGAHANTILAAMNPEYIPGLFTFSVLVSLLDLELDAELDISISFIDPCENIAANVGTSIQYEGDDSNIPQEYKGLNIAVDWNNVNLKMSGLYKLQVAVNGSILAEKPIFVKGKNEQ